MSPLRAAVSADLHKPMKRFSKRCPTDFNTADGTAGMTIDRSFTRGGRFSFCVSFRSNESNAVDIAPKYSHRSNLAPIVYFARIVSSTAKRIVESLDFDELLVCFVDRRSFKIRCILFVSSIVSLSYFFED